MPPWDASPKVGKFADDPSLSAAEIELIEKWVQNGVPEGDRKDLPKPAQFTDGWRIPRPDLIVTMPKAFRVPASGTLPYQYFTIDPGFREDKWIKASEVRPGNPGVVHHVVVIVQPPGAPSPEATGGIGDPVAIGAPGATPLSFPEGTARYVPAGSRLVLQMHYTPNGAEQIDRTSIGLVFADPKKVVRAMKAEIAVNVKLHPPGNPDYAATADYQLSQDVILCPVSAHAFAGRIVPHRGDLPEQATPGTARSASLPLRLAKPLCPGGAIAAPEGTFLHCDAHFDNSDLNLSNPNPKAEVRFGVQTWDEMLRVISICPRPIRICDWACPKE